MYEVHLIFMRSGNLEEQDYKRQHPQTFSVLNWTDTDIMANAMLTKFVFCTCGQGFPTKEEEIRHRKECFFCGDCSKRFGCRRTLLRHCKIYHMENSTLLNCDLCQFKTDYPSLLQRHERSLKHQQNVESVGKTFALLLVNAEKHQSFG